MSKMFVHYLGTVAAFKAAGLESKYTNHIVFIKGGENGTGEAVYTHGQYYGNVKDALAALQKQVNDMKYFSSVRTYDAEGKEVIASAASKDGIITFSAADPAQVNVEVGSNGVAIGLSKTFTDAVAANTANIAGEVSRATQAEGKIRTDLGQKEDAASAEGSAFARIAQVKADLAALQGEGGSVATQIREAIEALDVDALEGDYVAGISQADGKIVPVMGNFNFDEAGSADAAQAAAKDYTDAEIAKAKTYAEEQAASALADAKADSLAKIEALDANVTSLEEGHVTVQVVEVDGKITEVHVSESDIASAEALAALKADVDYFLGDALNKENVDALKDTLKELQEYIDSDVEGAAAMTASIQANAKAIEAEAKRADAAEKVNATAIKVEAQRAKDVEDHIYGQLDLVNDNMADQVNKIMGEINKEAARADAAEKVNAAAIAAEKQRAEAKEAELAQAIASGNSGSLASAKEYTDEKVNGLNVADAAVENQFVTAVSETAGKISVSRSSINASQIGITNTENDAFAAETQNVQAALTELASFWEWEELA